jgi:hypothetical protein
LSCVATSLSRVATSLSRVATKLVTCHSKFAKRVDFQSRLEHNMPRLIILRLRLLKQETS